jgi:hypothetical protein
VKGLLGEARQNVRDAANNDEDAVEEQLVTVSEEACEVAQVYDQIVSEETRGKVKAFTLAQLELDKVENPNKDWAAQ